MNLFPGLEPIFTILEFLFFELGQGWSPEKGPGRVCRFSSMDVVTLCWSIQKEAGHGSHPRVFR